MDAKISVPQGFTLGQILFILYINDLNKTFWMLKSIHFVDDTTLNLDINSSTDHMSRINSEWINATQLSLTVQKANYMIISSRKKIEN